MKYFVFYEDDYPDNGGVGLEVFDEVGKAEEFILDRMKSKDTEQIKYTVIKGEQMQIVKKEVTTKISIE